MQRLFALQKNLISFPKFTLISIFINEISVIELGDQTSAVTFNIFTPQGGALRQFFFGQAGRFGFLSQFVDSVNLFLFQKAVFLSSWILAESGCCTGAPPH